MWYVKYILIKKQTIKHPQRNKIARFHSSHLPSTYHRLLQFQIFNLGSPWEEAVWGRLAWSVKTLESLLWSTPPALLLPPPLLVLGPHDGCGHWFCSYILFLLRVFLFLSPDPLNSSPSRWSFCLFNWPSSPEVVFQDRDRSGVWDWTIISLGRPSYRWIFFNKHIPYCKNTLSPLWFFNSIFFALDYLL